MNSSSRRAGIALCGWLLSSVAAFGQYCDKAYRAEGTVFDPAQAVVPGAEVRTSDGATVKTDRAGRYVLPCLHGGAERLTASADGFANKEEVVRGHAGEIAHADFHLAVASVETSVDVGDDEGVGLDSGRGIGTHVLNQKEIQQLADDPDDFRRELQVLSAANGGAPGATRITVDGFQNTSALPPKSSISRIVTAPDLFSAEYDSPPYQGGRVEIYTKPGARSIHGAVFLTDSDSSLNATDPFSTVATPASKRRYGFELGGPLVKTKLDYFLALEKRDINEFNVVDAVTLDGSGNQMLLHQSVPAPEHLWIGLARADWQASMSDLATLSFAANTNQLSGQGVGGLTIADAGYDSTVSEYDLRATNTQTINRNLLQEARVAMMWKDTAQIPLSAAPAVAVAGFFQGGGSTAQNLNDRERDLEIDDDFLWSWGRHTWKIGAESLGIFVHDVDPDTFNGAFTFGGGQAPTLDANGNPTGQTTTISGLEQYRRALLNLPGGAPTSYQHTTGTALVPLTQWQLALYAEDTLKISSRLTLSAGLRYALQTSPESRGNIGPRMGLAWALDNGSKTVVHLHAGLFSSVVPEAVATESYRLNGTRQIESTIYSPSFTSPMTPTGQSVDVSTVRSLPNRLSQVPSLQFGVGMEHDFPKHWHVQANVFYADEWGDIRSRNINAPMVASSNNTAPNLAAALAAPRPIAINENIFQFEATGHLNGEVLFVGLDQHNYQRFGFFLGYLNSNLTNDAPSNSGFAQSAYSNKGEAAPPDFQARQRIFFFGNLNLPGKAELSAEMDAESGQPYRVTTGTDNNGDGVFNDRPSFALEGGAGIYSTRFGQLSTNTVDGDVRRNLGTMPSLIHLDMNLSRTWSLGPRNGHNEPTLRLNLRSANLLNHTNAAAVSTVVASPTFSQTVAAESARRLELGARFSF